MSTSNPDFLTLCKETLQQLACSKHELTVKDIETQLTCLVSEWHKSNVNQNESAHAMNRDHLCDILDNIHVVCMLYYQQLNTPSDGMLTLPMYMHDLLSALFQYTMQCFDESSCEWIAMIGIQMSNALKHKENTIEIIWRLLICKQIVSLIHKHKHHKRYPLQFSVKVEIIRTIMTVLNQYDIHRVHSFIYYGQLLWTHDYNYVHPKCTVSQPLNQMKCNELCASFHLVLFYVSSFFFDLATLLFDTRMNKIIFMDLSNEYLLFKKLQNTEHGFTIPQQINVRHLLLSYLRYCLGFEILTTKQSQIMDRGQDIEINLQRKISIHVLLKKYHDVNRKSYDLMVTQIIKSRHEIMDYFNENEAANTNEYIKYLAPIWRKELYECHKVNARSNKKRAMTRWDYYQKHASKQSNKQIEKEQELENRMGDCWEYLFFMTRFEILYVVENKLNGAQVNQCFGDVLFALFRMLRSYRDYHKIFALRLISVMMDKIDGLRCKALHKNAAVLLDSLRVTLAFREDAITRVLYPLIIKLMTHSQVLSIADQCQIYQSKYYNAHGEEPSSEEMQQNILILDSLEGIYQRINSDSNHLIHSMGKADVARKRMVIKYYLDQLKYEKILNVKRWSVVFDVVCEFMINSDDFEIVEMCFEYVECAMMECWMNIFSYHGKLILFVAKLCIKLDKYTSEDRQYVRYDLIKDRECLLGLCERTLLCLMLMCKSEKQSNAIKLKLNKMKRIPALSTLMENVVIAFDRQIETTKPNDLKQDDVLDID
eukprot:1007613_1